MLIIFSSKTRISSNKLNSSFLVHYNLFQLLLNTGYAPHQAQYRVVSIFNNADNPLLMCSTEASAKVKGQPQPQQQWMSVQSKLLEPTTSSKWWTPKGRVGLWADGTGQGEHWTEEAVEVVVRGLDATWQKRRQVFKRHCMYVGILSSL